MGKFLLVTVGAYALQEIALGLMAAPFRKGMGCEALWVGCQESDDILTAWLAFWKIIGACQLCLLAYHARSNPSKLRRLLSFIETSLLVQLTGAIFSQNSMSKQMRNTIIGTSLFLMHLSGAQVRSGGLGMPKENPIIPKDAASQALLLHGLLLMTTAGDLAVFRGFSRFKISEEDDTASSTTMNIQNWIIVMLLQLTLYATFALSYSSPFVKKRLCVLLGLSFAGSEALSRTFISSKVPNQMLVRGSFVNAALVGVMAYGFFSTKIKGGAAKGDAAAVSNRPRSD